MLSIRRWIAFGFCLFSAAKAQAAPPACDGLIFSVEQTRCYLARIAQLDASGPTLRSVLRLDPTAEAQARARDAERTAGKGLGALHGMPILVKDNIETRGLPTTAGSLALVANDNDREAPVVARLRDAGVVILGKTNLSEWANIRSSASTSAWSAVGGLTKNPYALDRSPCGSSSGSGAAVAAGLAAAAIGTETDGSITCPAAMNGIVGLKPSIGLLPQTYIVPISSSQDTAGPMTRNVTDAARLLAVMAGVPDAEYLPRNPDALKGARLGVLRFATGKHRGTDAVFEASLAKLREAGAVLVDITRAPDPSTLWAAEETILLTELKAGMNAYLAGVNPKVVTRSLADVIAFNIATPDELRYFGQELFEKAQATKGTTSPAYKKAVNAAKLARTTLDAMFAKDGLVAVVAPTTAPAWTADLIDGDHFLGEVSSLPAMAGYPHLTVPMGDVQGLPVGLSIIGPSRSEARLFSLGYAFEQVAGPHKPPTFPAHVP